MRPNFMAMLQSRQTEGKLVCVGLDTDSSRLPPCLSFDDGLNDPNITVSGRTEARAVIEFNQAIIRATAGHVCAFKPNAAFYQQSGGVGEDVLVETIRFANNYMPGAPIILDAKRGDIGNTNGGYAREAFEKYGADAVTVSPYMGSCDTYKPFLDRKDRGVIVLCRTSNKDAAKFQDRRAEATDGELDWVRSRSLDPEELGWTKVHLGLWLAPEYQLRAIDVAMNWNYNGNCALVVGATAPEQLRAVRVLVGDMPILVPGIGAQGGDLEATLKAGLTSKGDGLVINASRSVIFAWEQGKKRRGPDYDSSSFAILAQQEVERMNAVINNYRRSRSKESEL